ncbi:unnamed protein product [Withania somnifera]
MDLETSDCSFNGPDIPRCPFLSSFKEGPHFDRAFKFFHGKEGFVPLSNDNIDVESVPLLAAKVASISLSSLGAGGPFSFDSFSRKWNSQKKKRRKPLSEDKSCKHEAMGNEWLDKGNCPIAKSCRAVSGVLPLVASTFQLPPGIKLKCPPAVVAVRAALARTAFVKTMRPQPLSSKMLVIGALGVAANIPLGIWREHTEKFSLSWFTAVHAAVPFIAILRKSVVMPKAAMALTIAASILGQVIGSRAERFRRKAKAERVNLLAQTDSDGMPGVHGGKWEKLKDQPSKETTSVFSKLIEV